MLTLTEAASRKLGEVMAQQAEHGKSWYGLRLNAQAGCCSGPKYGLSLAEEVRTDDWVGEFGGVRVLVDPESAPLASGLRIDYVETPEATGFAIENPNPAPRSGGCGCGRHSERA